jgi:iron complex outermembrane receptor protein
MSLLFPSVLFAQSEGQNAAPAVEDASGGLAEVIVTAEKRSTSLQRTPVAVTAFGGEQIAEEQIRDLRDLSVIVPNFKAAEAEGFPQITIRGIGIQNFTPLAESAVAVNVNEVYVSRPSGFLSSMFDMSAVDVLRGPQGTLFGRNATAGAINMTTVRPTEELSGYMRLVGGDFDEIRGEAAVGGRSYRGYY